MQPLSIHAWMECIVLTLNLCSFVENNVIKKTFKHPTITVDTLVSFIWKHTAQVEKKVAKFSSDRFSVISHGWSRGDTHYFAILASYPDVHSSECTSSLLALAPMGDKCSRRADDLYEYLEFFCLFMKRTCQTLCQLTVTTKITKRN